MSPHPSPQAPRLVALATAVPPFDLPQDEVAERAATLFAPTEGGFHRLAPIYCNALIERRHACVPLDWFLEDHGFRERNALFLHHATDLLAQAAGKALADADLEAADIDTIVTVCTSGIATPGLDARLMGRLPFRDDVQRLPVFGLGCAGGVLGLSRAAAMAQAAPGSRVLLLVVELCTLTFRRQDRSKSNLVATALFGDGAAAAVITCPRDGDEEGVAPTAPRLGPWGEHTWPDSLDVMGWDIQDDGLKVVFSRDIPALVRDDMRPILDSFLARHDLSLRDIDEFVCHPGGAKVIDALEDCFELQRGDLVHTRQTLRDHGNMSAVTVLFVLKAALDARAGGRRLLTTLGPGFTAAMMMIDA
ncbi:MAG TPA: 3-oxoacyl-[acyl-carrier-protein] synthase III C-terminal domain-containing protein [Caulobacteraceae bacterium]|nr:3-oxoacyl-[acyl-carrier-protein] synthase III C-terminal domain-containing protein [Caulobacteraceae bacterium]